MFNLIKGEFKRLIRYKILIVGLVASFLWAIIIALADNNLAHELIPVLISLDTAMMSIILIAASFHFEKQENTIKSIFVSPVTPFSVLSSKIIASVMMSIISTVVVLLAGVIFHEITIQMVLLSLLYVLIITISHLAIGLLMVLHTKDFSSMLGIYVLFFLVSFFPSLLYDIGLFDEGLKGWLMISPTHDANLLLSSVFTNVEIFEIIIPICYMILISIVLYPGFIYKKFKYYAIGG